MIVIVYLFFTPENEVMGETLKTRIKYNTENTDCVSVLPPACTPLVCMAGRVRWWQACAGTDPR